jgi:hypothetical protein
VSDQGGSAAAAPAENGNGNGGGEPSGLYAEALQGVPQELHGYVEPVLKQWDQKVNPKLQEAAELRKQYGELSKVEGLADIAPEHLSELVGLHALLTNPESQPEEVRQQLVGQIAEMLGVEPEGGELAENDWVQLGIDNGWFQGEDGEQQQGGVDLNAFKQELLAEIRGEIEPVKQTLGKQEEEQRNRQTQAELETRMGELVGQLGDLDDAAKSDAALAIRDLAWAFTKDEDPLGKAFERYKAITGKAQGDLVDRKLQQPNGALSGGRTSNEQPRVSWNGGVSPREVALERMKA